MKNLNYLVLILFLFALSACSMQAKGRCNGIPARCAKPCCKADKDCPCKPCKEEAHKKKCPYEKK